MAFWSGKWLRAAPPAGPLQAAGPSGVRSVGRAVFFRCRLVFLLGVNTFFSASTIYILLLIFSPDHLYSREYSRILRIFSPRDRSTDAKNRSKVQVCALKPLMNVQKFNISVCIDPKPTVEGQKSCFEKLRQDRSRRRDCNLENIQEYLETRGQLRSSAEESS